ncbi:MAG TPA: glycosyltransferase family 2 protein [Lacunisphaera sp.]|nr:glycosyltransferase family 2 protein [Lacunisphaera sp.]
MSTTPASPLRDGDAAPGGVREELDLTIFIPCLNEEKRVVPTLETVRAALAELSLSYEVIVVDDGSTDRTAAVVEEFCRAHPDLPVRLHRNPRNLGLSRSFVDTAFRGRGRYYRLVCGDNVEPKESMLKILRAAGTADIIIPYYPVLPGKSRLRKFISGLYTRIVDLLGGYRIKYYNGCALYRRYHVMRWASYNYGFGFQAHLITTLLDEGATYVQVPLEGFHLTKDRGSPLNLRNFLSTGHTLCEIFIRRLRRTIYRN